MTLTTEQRRILRYLEDYRFQLRTSAEVGAACNLYRAIAYRRLRKLNKAGLVEQISGFLWVITDEGRLALWSTEEL